MNLKQKIEWDRKGLHVWRHSDIVVACLKKLLQSGQVMHAAIVFLLTFATSFDIIGYRSLQIYNWINTYSCKIASVTAWCCYDTTSNFTFIIVGIL
jgi:hypothetical protein